MVVALLLCVCPCTPVEEGRYGHGRHVWTRKWILLVWSDFCLHGVLLCVCVCVRVPYESGPMILILCGHYQWDLCWPWWIWSGLWLMMGHGGDGVCDFDNSVTECACMCVCVFICIVLTNVRPGGFWCALTLNTAVTTTTTAAQAVLIALPIMLSVWCIQVLDLSDNTSWSTTSVSLAICCHGNKVSRVGQWKWMGPLSISCRCCDWRLAGMH